MTRAEAVSTAFNDYWAAGCYDEEHAAIQRLIALEQDDEWSPCPEAGCVALREATIAAIEPDEAHEEIEITEEMVEAGLQFLSDAGFPSLSARAESPEFVEDFLRSAIVGRRSLKDAVKASTSSIRPRKLLTRDRKSSIGTK